MPGLSFLNPALLWGLGLVGVPILIHFLQRRRPALVPWGAMEFLRLSSRRRSRRLMLEQLLLLLLRCLIAALLALALSRPVMRLPGAAGLARGPVHAVIVLDNSYSMGYRLEPGSDRTALDAARDRALQLLRTGLRQGDAVSLILASDPPSAPLRAPTLDLDLAARQIRSGVTLSERSTSYSGAAGLALQVARDSKFANREVYFIGDAQRTGWDAGDRQVWQELADRARTVIVPVREASADNLAVEWVQAAGGVAVAGVETTIQARVVNHGRAPVRGRRVLLETSGGRTSTAATVSLDPGQAEVVRFHQIFASPGDYECVVRLQADRLPLDDRAMLALRVRRRLRVLLLRDGGAASSAAEDPSLFLQLALAPPAEGDAPSEQQMEVRLVNRGDLPAALKEGADLAVLCDLRELPQAERQMLGSFVQQGGGLLVFPGTRAEPALYNRDLAAGSPRLLPARLGARVSQETSLDAQSIQHPALERFRGARDIEPGTARFKQHYRLELPDVPRGSDVIARFSGGDPAIVEGSFGRGRLLLFAFSPIPAWTDLPLKPAFVPLVHLLAGYAAAGAGSGGSARVGDDLYHPVLLDQAAGVRVQGPGGFNRTLKPRMDGAGAAVQLENVARSGFYRFRTGTGAAALYAVNLPGGEADLHSLSREEAAAMTGTSQVQMLRPDDNLVTAVQRIRQGVELWSWMLMAALVLMLAETALAQLFGRRA